MFRISYSEKIFGWFSEHIAGHALNIADCSYLVSYCLSAVSTTCSFVAVENRYEATGCTPEEGCVGYPAGLGKLQFLSMTGIELRFTGHPAGSEVIIL